MKQLRLNGFEMGCPCHLAPGMWTLPHDDSAAYNRLPYWADLAQRLEEGLFDGLFLADVGVYDVLGGRSEAALRNGAQVPLIDPMLLVPTMA